MSVDVALETTHPQARAARRLRLWAVADPDDAPAELLAAAMSVAKAHAVAAVGGSEWCLCCGPLPTGGVCEVLTALITSIGAMA